MGVWGYGSVGVTVNGHTANRQLPTANAQGVN